MKYKHELMTEDAILVLTEILIKEHLNGKKQKYVVTKQQLLQLCIKVVKEMKRVYG